MLAEIMLERERQEHLHESGKLPHVASEKDCPNDLRLAALVEEVGEVARAYHDGRNIRGELIQVAAVAIAWLEGLSPHVDPSPTERAEASQS